MGKNTRKNKITKTRTLVNRKILQRKNKEIMDLKNEISNLKKYYSKDNLTNTFNKSNGIRRLQLELNRTITQNAPKGCFCLRSMYPTSVLLLSDQAVHSALYQMIYYL